MASQTQYPSSVTNEDNSSGPDWSNPSNAAADDGVYATVFEASRTINSDWLVASFTGFTIPSGQTIQGVKASIRWYAPSDYNYANARLICDGTTSSQRGYSDVLPTTAATGTIGSSTDKWGLTNLTTARVNAGLTFKMYVEFNSSVPGYTNETVYVDWITLEVFYEPTPADSDKMFLMF